MIPWPNNRQNHPLLAVSFPNCIGIPIFPVPRAESPSCDSPARRAGNRSSRIFQALKERHKNGVPCSGPRGGGKLTTPVGTFAPKVRHSPIDNQETGAYTGSMKYESNRKTAVE